MYWFIHLKYHSICLMIHFSQTFDQLFYTLQTKDIKTFALLFHSRTNKISFFFRISIIDKRKKSIFNHHLNFKRQAFEQLLKNDWMLQMNKIVFYLESSWMTYVDNCKKKHISQSSSIQHLHVLLQVQSYWSIKWCWITSNAWMVLITVSSR